MSIIPACLVLVLGFAVLINDIKAATPEETAAMAKLKDACVKQIGLTPEEASLISGATEIKSDGKPVSKNLQCYVLCFYKNLGLIDESGKQKPEVIYKYMERVFTDKTKIKPALEKCASVKGENACEVVYNFENCIEGLM
ncbi:general odorant-binding protein 56a [Teleopsis dalmanni]|uniref:general odorant-binding protein 56a n=1 Tax=Teleopsis dalmanni TaxID=139649 RepID=UPI0018CD9A8C|nr:general odorant-binding protein 56a [Teleopsis dalmanni]